MQQLSKRPEARLAKAAKRPNDSAPSSSRRRMMVFAIPGALVLLVVIGFVVRHLALAPTAKRERYPTNEDLAHDPETSRRVRNVFQEEIQGSSYVNRDLNLSVARPEGWKLATGSRPEFGEKYEGLIVKICPPADPKIAFQPLASLVRRSLNAGMPQEPIAYIRSILLSDKKIVVLEPEAVRVNGMTMARVAYDMDGLRVTQYVAIQKGAAYTVSLACPKERWDDCKATLESVVASFHIGE